MITSELTRVVSGITVMRDADFDALGMATSLFREERVLSFLADNRFLQAVVDNVNITTIVTTQHIYDNSKMPENLGIIISDDPKLSFYEIHNILVETDFYWRKFENRVAASAMISERAVIAENSVSIGSNSVIEPGVVVHSGSIIGDNVIIRSGSQIGTTGFQFVNRGESVFVVKTGGRAVIKDNVEIQHNCCVDRGVLGGDTVVSEFVKIDNCVHIAHDDFIGKRTFITAGVKMGGRVTIGQDCWIGVNATLTNGINIGNNCKVTLGAVVTRNVADGSTVSGNFAIDHSRFLEFIKSIR